MTLILNLLGIRHRLHLLRYGLFVLLLCVFKHELGLFTVEDKL